MEQRSGFCGKHNYSWTFFLILSALTCSSTLSISLGWPRNTWDPWLSRQPWRPRHWGCWSTRESCSANVLVLRLHSHCRFLLALLGVCSIGSCRDSPVSADVAAGPASLGPLNAGFVYMAAVGAKLVVPLMGIRGMQLLDPCMGYDSKQGQQMNKSHQFCICSSQFHSMHMKYIYLGHHYLCFLPPPTEALLPTELSYFHGSCLLQDWI